MSKVHFVPDYKFENPMFGPADWKAKARKMLKTEEKQMKSDFMPQIMCDPEPESEKPWGKGCEQFCGKQKRGDMPGAMDGPGVIVVLSDPAPWKEGAYGSLTEKIRGDGTKDYWSIAVLRLRAREDLSEGILLDGAHSLSWGDDDGLDIAAGFMKQYKTNLFVSEDQNAWFEPMVRAARRNAVSYRRAKNGGPFKYEIYNQAKRKTKAFAALADWARNGQFYICDETCSDEFLYGDREHTGFLTQARKCRPVAQGKWNLRFDDDIDVVSRIRDPIFTRLAPREEVKDGMSRVWWAPKQEEEFTWTGGKHVRA